MSKSIIFLVKSFLGNFYSQLAILSCHTVTSTETQSKSFRSGNDPDPDSSWTGTGSADQLWRQRGSLKRCRKLKKLAPIRWPLGCPIGRPDWSPFFSFRRPPHLSRCWSRRRWPPCGRVQPVWCNTVGAWLDRTMGENWNFKIKLGTI